MAVHNHCISTIRYDVGPLDISWLALFFYAENEFLHVIRYRSIDATEPDPPALQAAFAAVFLL